MQNISMLTAFKCGYSGGIGGDEFDDYINEEIRNAQSLAIRRVEVKTNLIPNVIGSIQIVYTINGNSLMGEKHGGVGGGNIGGTKYTFDLDEEEYITGITGRFGAVIDSLQIHTNKKSSPVYGGGGGKANYSYFAPSQCEIIAFFGRSRAVVDGIGVIMRNRIN